MTSSQAVAETILELTSEDYYGLWEIYWKVRDDHPELGDELGDVLKYVLDTLWRSGKIEFFTRTILEEEPVAANPELIEWHRAVRSESPERGQVQILVASRGI